MQNCAERIALFLTVELLNLQVTELKYKWDLGGLIPSLELNRHVNEAGFKMWGAERTGESLTGPLLPTVGHRAWLPFWALGPRCYLRQACRWTSQCVTVEKWWVQGRDRWRREMHACPNPHSGKSHWSLSICRFIFSAIQLHWHSPFRLHIPAVLSLLLQVCTAESPFIHTSSVTHPGLER